MENNYKFVGWIPCLLGRLDFSLMTPALSGSFTLGRDKDKKVVNKCFYNANGSLDRIVMQSRVDWGDSPGYSKKLASFRIFTIGQVDQERCILKGSILIYQSSAEQPKCVYVNELVHALEICRVNRSGELEKESSSKLFEKLQGVIRGRSEGWDRGLSESANTYHIDFEIHQDGLVFLNLNCSKFPLDVDQDGQELVVRQAYYYLKYSLHNHKHHDDKGDALTRTVEFHATKPTDVGLALLNQLKKELVDLKRHPKIHTSNPDQEVLSNVVSNALGVTAYAKSLLTTLRRRQWIPEDVFTDQMDFLDNYGVSANVFLCNKRGIAQTKNSATQNALFVTTIVAAILFATVQIFLRNADDDAKFVITTQQTTLIVLGVVLVILLSYWLAEFIPKFRMALAYKSRVRASKGKMVLSVIIFAALAIGVYVG